MSNGLFLGISGEQPPMPAYQITSHSGTGIHLAGSDHVISERPPKPELGLHGRSTMTLLRFAGLIRPVGMPRTNTQVAMVWNQYLYLVYAGSILALWKAQNILTMDF